MSPERRERIVACLLRVANVVPVCTHHHSPVVAEAQLMSLSDHALSEVVKNLEHIVDEAMGTDAE